MKKSYIKLLLFSFVFIIIFLLNSFVFHFLSQITLDILLILLTLLTYFLFGFEKDRHRYAKNIMLEIIIVLVGFFLLYYLFGILIGFARTSNYLTGNSLINIIIPLIVYIFLKEYLRYQLINKASESKWLILSIIILFIVMDSTLSFSAHNIGVNRETFLLISMYFIPSIVENILCTFLCLKFGYWPSILYLLIIKLYQYILPIVPNPNEYIYALIALLLPVVLLLHIKHWLLKDRTEALASSDYKTRKKQAIYYVPIILMTMVLVYFISGYFKYYAVAIASGSMERVFSKGDVVIVDQKYNSLKENDIIAYHHEGIIVVHRIYKIIDVHNTKYIYTKGDANSKQDNWKITEDDVVGVVKFRIPFVGYPTVMLNESW